MATTATPTKLFGRQIHGEWWEAFFSLVLDTTTDAGLMTVDLTKYFKYVEGISICGNKIERPYQVSALVPDHDTEADATNTGLYFHQSPAKTGGADSAEVLDSVDSTSLATAITGLRIKVIGRRDLTSSWA